MYITENLTVNGGDLALGSAVNFDLRIVGKFCKIVSIKIVQLTGGPMDIDFQVWESTAARADPGNRVNLYQEIIARHITLTALQGGQYGESLAGHPMPYYDRDVQDPNAERVEGYRLHCRLDNFAAGGTASDFAVSIKIADMGENI